MPIVNDRDYILLQVESLKKLLARLLKNNAMEKLSLRSKKD